MIITDTLDERTFNRISQFVYAQTGIVLGPHKMALVTARLGKRMRKLGVSSFKAYFERVLQDSSGEEVIEMVNAISTNVTHFFREAAHFNKFSAILRERERAGQTKFRVWCAAASTGQEPYTLAITMLESLQNQSDARILATDISTKALARAVRGVYSEAEVEKIPPAILARYFDDTIEESGRAYAVKQAVKSKVKFARLNLIKTPYPLKGSLDAIFCRNVLIYFDSETRQRIVAELLRLLKNGGHLFVGHAESLSGCHQGLVILEPSVYLKK